MAPGGMGPGPMGPGQMGPGPMGPGPMGPGPMGPGPMGPGPMGPGGFGGPQYDPIVMMFQQYDRDRSGTISLSEMHAFKYQGRSFSTKTLRAIMRIFDREGRGEINIQLFRFMCNFMHASAEQFGRVSGRKTTINSMLALDAMRAQQYEVTIEGIRNYLNMLKANQPVSARDTVSFDDYMALVTHFAHAKTIFQMRDMRNTGTITLSLPEFMFLSTQFV
jgi:hypothetical protein